MIDNLTDLSMIKQETEKAIKIAQELLDEIMQTRPYCEYAKARQLGLIDDKLALLDKLQEQGLIRITKKCGCTKI